MLRSLSRWMGATGFSRPIAWTFLPTPLVRELIARLDPSLTIYHCVDEFASSSTDARRIVESEEQLFRSADLVFVTSERLRERASRYSERVHLFPSGVSLETFAAGDAARALPADVASLPRPIVGYVGGLHQWVDQDLVADTAALMPEASFVMVGPPQTDLTRLKQAPNVHILGQRPHAEVPGVRVGIRRDAGAVPHHRLHGECVSGQDDRVPRDGEAGGVHRPRRGAPLQPRAWRRGPGRVGRRRLRRRHPRRVGAGIGGRGRAPDRCGESQRLGPPRAGDDGAGRRGRGGQEQRRARVGRSAAAALYDRAAADRARRARAGARLRAPVPDAAAVVGGLAAAGGDAAATGRRDRRVRRRRRRVGQGRRRVHRARHAGRCALSRRPCETPRVFVRLCLHVARSGTHEGRRRGQRRAGRCDCARRVGEEHL